MLPFLVCVQNQNNPDRDFSDASEPHGSAFLVGRISDVIPSPEDPNSGRWMIQISEYATVQNPKNVWQGWRNPVKYGALEDFDIDVSKLVFHSVADIQKDLDPSPQQPKLPQADDRGAAPISITVAKRGLAAFYGVPPDAVEIVIRGDQAAAVAHQNSASEKRLPVNGAPDADCRFSHRPPLTQPLGDEHGVRFLEVVLVTRIASLGRVRPAGNHPQAAGFIPQCARRG
jgi:hypothetical protein